MRTNRGQISLLPSAGWELRTGQGAAVAFCGCGKVTVGLTRTGCASHALWYPSMGLSGIKTGDEQSAYALVGVLHLWAHSMGP